MDVRQVAAPDFLFQRPSANQHQLRSAPAADQRLPGAEQELEILLPGDAADVGDEEIVGTDPEPLPVGFAPEPGVELGRVHSPAPQSGVGDTSAVQVLLVDPAGTEHPMGLAVEPAEIEIGRASKKEK